jgi:hypothetical protein
MSSPVLFLSTKRKVRLGQCVSKALMTDTTMITYCYGSSLGLKQRQSDYQCFLTHSGTQHTVSKYNILCVLYAHRDAPLLSDCLMHKGYASKEKGSSIS